MVPPWSHRVVHGSSRVKSSAVISEGFDAGSGKGCEGSAEEVSLMGDEAAKGRGNAEQSEEGRGFSLTRVGAQRKRAPPGCADARRVRRSPAKARTWLQDGECGDRARR